MKFFILPVLTNLGLKMDTAIEIKVEQLTNHRNASPASLHIQRQGNLNQGKTDTAALACAAVSVDQRSRMCKPFADFS